MLSIDTFLQFLDVLQCCSTEEAVCHDPMMLAGGEGATVSQMSEGLLRWLHSKVAANLRCELLLDDSARATSSKRYTASSKKPMVPKSGATLCDATPATTAASASQRGSALAGPREDDCLRVRAAASSAALAMLSMALWPLVQDPQTAISTAGDTRETSAVCQIERVCAVLLRLVTSNLDGCHGAWAAHEPAPSPSLISSSAVRLHLAASLKMWMHYFLLFFMDWLHFLRSSIPSASDIATKQQRAAAAATGALRRQTRKPTAEAVRDGDRQTLQRGQSALLPDPLRGCPADLARHPLHYYAQALQRVAATIESGCGTAPKRSSEGDDDELWATSQSCAEHHKCGSPALPCVSAGRRRGAPLGGWGAVRRRCVEASSNSSVSDGSATRFPTESPPLFCAFAPQRRRRAPAKSLPKRHALGGPDASADDDVPLSELAERLRARTLV
ncbi:hypothetical protein LMJF_32_3550 [Leishmania major strain Friedlin]|uniref:Uncharacterized protein n=1 Tax=Leishmania major TaxID=5664 RepID=Q4Q4R7_LEIMA|nr:hypothetical protein LMJF_32_3550 [Leishmania major strain Friedlin]CAG9580505.1 hypothetical_protein_-_conserved [Leishmania major strain Friedlin]CAJ08886.1 hypothetical protein LMJF_32_3550 [Leishmania major strain Friedlin]|eukprot:XP_001685681.1 hypothetical protein LMJF_32_3550 [Leishmania major strain Friedlin]